MLGALDPDEYAHLAPPDLLGGLFGASRDRNPYFYAFNKVWLPDCTLDLWLGANRSTCVSTKLSWSGARIEASRMPLASQAARAWS